MVATGTSVWLTAEVRVQLLLYDHSSSTSNPLSNVLMLTIKIMLFAGWIVAINYIYITVMNILFCQALSLRQGPSKHFGSLFPFLTDLH